MEKRKKLINVPTTVIFDSVILWFTKMMKKCTRKNIKYVPIGKFANETICSNLITNIRHEIYDLFHQALKPSDNPSYGITTALFGNSGKWAHLQLTSDNKLDLCIGFMFDDYVSKTDSDLILGKAKVTKQISIIITRLEEIYDNIDHESTDTNIMKLDIRLKSIIDKLFDFLIKLRPIYEQYSEAGSVLNIEDASHTATSYTGINRWPLRDECVSPVVSGEVGDDYPNAFTYYMKLL